MAMINIPSTNDDPAYRYKMPKLTTQKEGRGNGSKTCIKNMGDVARALKRPPQYTTKWFGTELGAQCTYTNKEGEGERAIVNGHHDTSVFQDLLDKFIDKYVCCTNCRLPEIDLAVKRGNIVGRCLACGWAGDLDSNHKLAAFIIKNPPDESGNGLKSEGGDDSKMSKAERRQAKAMKRAQKQEDQGDDEGDEVERDDDSDADEEKKKQKKDKKDKKDKKKKKKEKKDSDDEDEDGDDSDGERKERKEKKEKKEKKDKKDKKEKKDKKDKKDKKEKKDKKDKKDKKEKKAKKDSDSEDERSGSDAEEASGKGGDDMNWDDEDVKSVISSLASLVAAGKPKPGPFYEELVDHKVSKGLDNKLSMYAVLQALFGESCDAKGIESTKGIIDNIVTKLSVTAPEMLWSLNCYVHANSARGFAHVLKAVYDEDWVDEKSVLSYYQEDQGEGEPGFEEAKRAAAPFLKWLEEASSEEDDDEDEDEDSD